ncbi:class I SAM-dependent methyltransferase [Phycisphaerales bacterium AB-hyl4]|uniref:Class I SAM-dependent methyltransferase n=1 Tax=Natronomicrosphaera hydrolytica TaxID=3242702 RepID=A0ABV4U8E9_9BACT
MPTYEPSDWYRTPLYYDIIFDEGTRREADFLQAVFEWYGGAAVGRVLEPACGTGRLMAELGRRGCEVSGFDVSLPMLEFAGGRLDDANVAGELKQARLERFHYRKRFDFAHCLVSTFLYLADEAAARDHLQRMARSLRPGGVYVLGLHLTDYDDRGRTRERWVGQRDGVDVVCNVQAWPADRRKRAQQVRSRLVVQADGATRRYQTQWTFRTYSERQLRRLLASVPTLEHVATYNFHHDVEQLVSLGDGELDKVLVLRRRDG